ncbi:MAG TPA: hypothetical protein VKT78_09295, partial [Fimbriimonadaceae bacterium]|nr:hypothetical protein [Fimbriimonadaceae bacterium]
MQINVGHRKARIARPLIAALAISLVLSTYLPSGAYAFQQPCGPTVTEKWDNGNTQTTTETTTSADGSQVVTTTHYDKDGTTKTGEQVDTYGKKPNDKVVIHRKVRKWKGDPNTTQPVQETTDTFDANNGSITGGTRTDVTRDGNGTETNVDTYVWEPNGKEPGGGHWKRTSHTPLKVENGLLRTEIKTANGTIVVNLPEDMEPGDKITGSVIMHPAGNTPEEQQKNEAELNGNVVSIAGHEIKGPGYAAILVPAVGAGLIDLLVRNPRGKKVTDQPIPITTSCPPAPPVTDKPTPRDFHLPTVGQAGRPLRLTGPFAGDVANTNVAVGGKPVPILAESPRETIAVAPHATGAMPLSVTDRGVTAVGEFVNLACRLSAGKTSMNIDETEPLWLKIDGVGALKGPASVRLQNF